MAETNTPVEELETETPDVEPDEGDEIEPGEAQGTGENEPPEDTFTKRFNQFQGESPEEYAKQLEDAYDNSSKEALNIKRQLDDTKRENDRLLSVVASNPEVARQLVQPQAPAAPQVPQGMQGIQGQQTTDPALLFYREKFNEESQSQYNEFVDNHPELRSDSALASDMNRRIYAYGQAVRTSENRQPSMKEAIEAAWVISGRPLNATKEEVIQMAQKSIAGQGRRSSGRPVAPNAASNYTEEQLEMARRVYPGLSDEELEKKLTESLQSTQPR